LNAPFIFEPWQFLALSLGLCCNTWRNLRSPPLFNNDGAARVPVNLGILSEVDLHQNETVLVFGEKAQDRVPSHQFTSGREDDRNA
jgi:hypothetical protein